MSGAALDVLKVVEVPHRPMRRDRLYILAFGPWCRLYEVLSMDVILSCSLWKVPEL